MGARLANQEKLLSAPLTVFYDQSIVSVCVIITEMGRESEKWRVRDREKDCEREAKELESEREAKELESEREGERV